MIPSKFRLGVEPEPFCLELHLPSDAPWTLEDVTEHLIMAGEEAKAAAEQTQQKRRHTAAMALAELVPDRA